MALIRQPAFRLRSNVVHIFLLQNKIGIETFLFANHKYSSKLNFKISGVKKTKTFKLTIACVCVL